MSNELYISQILILQKLKILVDWTPKAGCTTICKMAFKKLGILNEALAHSNWIHNFRSDKFYKRYGVVKELELINGKFNDFQIIKFVRNPYSRAISSYIHAMKTPRLNKIVGSNDISFHHFLNLFKNEIIEVEGHWRVQKIYYENNPKLKIKYVKIEKLEQELINLKKNKIVDFEYGFSSNHHVKKNEDKTNFVGNMKFSKYKNEIPNYRYFYNDKIKKLVEEIYKEDILTYKYSYNDFLKEN